MASIELPAVAFDPNNLRISLLSKQSGGTRPVSISFSLLEAEDQEGYDDEPQPEVPKHPVPLLQDAFTESLEEVTRGGGEGKPHLRDLNAEQRRDRLLAQPKNEKPWDYSWRYRHDQKQHEIAKLISQISFGVYLLLNGMANDHDQVVNILQGHIDEADEFLEVTLEDLDLAATDLRSRWEDIKLPLANAKTFEHRLEDRAYRAEILEENEKVEGVLARMEEAFKMWDDDIEAGVQCSTAFAEWLTSQQAATWRKERPELEDIYNAMRGNGEGWLQAFDEINKRTQAINDLMVSLTNTVTDIETRVGEISRKLAAFVQPYSSPNGSAAPSIASPPRSAGGSFHQGTPRYSNRSGADSQTVSFRVASIGSSDFDQYELPGSAPLLPPTRYSARPPQRGNSPQLTVQTAPTSPRSDAEEGNLFILQPRTYTPKIPQPFQSPVLRGSPSLPVLDKRTSASTQGRSSVNTMPPGAIQIPPPRHSAGSRSNQLSPTWSAPRSSNSYHRDSGYQHDSEYPRDSAYSNGSDMESHQRQPHRVGSYQDFSGLVRPPLRQAPNSDYQQVRPLNSPPLRNTMMQQRPHTAVPGSQGQAGFGSPGQPRRLPSRLGATGGLETVEDGDSGQFRPHTPGGTAVQGNPDLKKKKSGAFGWFKKAFTMDEAERAAFEARRGMQAEGKYYSSQGQRFLDGKRVR